MPINSFGLMVALSFLAGVCLLSRSFERNGLNPVLAERYVLVAGFVGLIGARVWYVIEHFAELQGNLIEALLSTAGFTFYGGFIVSTAALIIMARRDGIKVSALADSVGPTLALAYAIGRLGCQLSGDGDYGIETASIFGMSFQTGVVPTPPGVLVFPTPLYESAIALAMLFVLLKLEVSPTWQAPYKRLGGYLVLIAAERFAVEFLRVNPKHSFGLSEAQFIAIGLIAVGTFLIGRTKVRT